MTAPRVALTVMAGALALTILTGCRAGDEKKAAPPATGDSASKGMADMPGMSGTPGNAKGSPARSTGADEGADRGALKVGVVDFTAAQIQHGGVQWGPATIGKAPASGIIPGLLVPNEDRTARLGAPTQGRVVQVRVQPGDRVARGQLLVTMQSPEASIAQADVSKATAELTSRQAAARYARAARDRAERLLAIKAIPRQEYERAIADDEAAAAEAAQAQAELRRARSTAEQLGTSAGSASGEIGIRSPLAGVVLQRTAMPGTVVDAGASLVVVTDPSSLWLQISAPEQLSSLLRRGAQLRFTVPAYAEETFSARVSAVGAGLDPDTRTLGVRATVASQGRLKAEMLASVTVEGSGIAAGVVLPEDAVQLMDGKPTVFIAAPDGKGGARFEARIVEVGARSGGRVTILRGLAAGDIVVTRGAVAVRTQLKKGSMPDMEM